MTNNVRLYDSEENKYVDGPLVLTYTPLEGLEKVVVDVQKRYIVENYIGKLDINKKPIAEGDIVKMGKIEGMVKFSGKECGYVVLSEDGKETRITRAKKVEIVREGQA